MSRDEARRFALEFRDRLFRAVDEGNFESIPALGRQYCNHVRCIVQLCSASEAAELEILLSAPLREAIRYLRSVRAQKSASFRKLAKDRVYGNDSVAVSTRNTLRLNA